MSSEYVDRFSALFPVSLDKYDYVLPLFSYDKVYICRQITESKTTFLTCDIGMWSFISVFTNQDDARKHIETCNIEGLTPDSISVYELLHTFRSWSLDGELLFVGSTKDYLPSNIQTHYGGPLYPSTSLMVLVAIDTAAWSRRELKLLTCTHSDVQNAVYVADSLFSLISQIAHEQSYVTDKGSYLLAYIPIQTIAAKYKGVLFDNSYYDLETFLSLTAHSLSLMSDDFIAQIKEGKEDVV